MYTNYYSEAVGRFNFIQALQLEAEIWVNGRNGELEKMVFKGD